MGNKYYPTILFLETNDSDDWFKDEKLYNTTKSDEEESDDLSSMPLLEDDKKAPHMRPLEG